ncbi:hypothetical protein [Edaphobacter modestus]|uniref:Uncharacterized protein n=1 Tax=Edaphobacter modestus TaxID=388466 RepID=A0A4Q7Y213_9BACT|nr:hypothetical protein [Edaphobacter modestus]RZU29815.1 hypothetical protein BDD14_6448 [Edaphobacter modestus]
MTRNSRTRYMLGILLAAASISTVCTPQQPPKTVSIIRNDATSKVTVEFHNGDEWEQIPIDAQKDTPIAGDRIRVATTRDDKAIMTVDLPIEGGKKYRLFWNDKTSMWDFRSAS